MPDLYPELQRATFAVRQSHIDRLRSLGVDMAALAEMGRHFHPFGVARVDVGSYSDEVKFNSTAPYLGIGWGNPAGKDKTWGLTSDIGVLFQGAPKVTGTVTCGAALTAPQCVQLQSDVAAGATQLETDLKNYKYYPVISIGISYRF